MIHTADELVELDTAVERLSRARTQSDKLDACKDIMRAVCFHDWPTWAPKHRWSVDANYFHELDHDVAEALRPLVRACVQLLKTNGSHGGDELQQAAQTFLIHRDLLVPSVPVVGVKLLDAAFLVNDGERDAAREAKRRWLNSGRLPKPVGKIGKQTNLFDVAELAAFICEVERWHGKPRPIERMLATRTQPATV